MKTTPQLSLLIETVRGLSRNEDETPEEALTTMLWLLASSEDCRRTLEAAAPTREALEKFCLQMGDPARAWVQFSPPACDLLNRAEARPSHQLTQL